MSAPAGKTAKVKALTVAIVAVIVIAVAAAVAYFILLRPAPPAPALPPKEEIVFGYVDHFTGPLASGTFLTSTSLVRTIVEDYNAMGGLYVPEYGKKLRIKVIEYDDRSDVETLIRLTEKCMVEEKVDFMFPPWSTGSQFAVSPLYEKYGYPQIGINMGSDQIVQAIKRGEIKWLFPALCQPSFIVGHVKKFLEYAIPKAGASGIGIIYIADLHGIEFSSAFFRELSLWGQYPILVYESYPMGVTDLSPLIKKLKEEGVDVLVACTYPEDAILILRQMRELDYNPKIMFLGPASSIFGLYASALGVDVMQGVMGYHGIAINFKMVPKAKELTMRWKDIVGHPVYGIAIYYGGLEMLFKAVEKCGLDRVKVREALAKEAFETVCGLSRFNLVDCYLEFDALGWVAQWQGDLPVVVWPPEKAEAEFIVKPPWPK